MKNNLELILINKAQVRAVQPIFGILPLLGFRRAPSPSGKIFRQHQTCFFSLCVLYEAGTHKLYIIPLGNDGEGGLFRALPHVPELCGIDVCNSCQCVQVGAHIPSKIHDNFFCGIQLKGRQYVIFCSAG